MEKLLTDQRALYGRMLDIFDADEFLFTSAQITIAAWNKEVRHAMRQRHADDCTRSKVGFPVLDLSWKDGPFGEFPETTLRLRFTSEPQWRSAMGLLPLGYVNTTLGPDFRAYELAPILKLANCWEQELIGGQVNRARKMQSYLRNVWEVDDQIRQNLVEARIMP